MNSSGFRLTKKSIAALIIMFALLAYLALYRTKVSFNIRDFDTDVVQIGDIEKVITANGTINPVKVVNVGTQVSGTIVKIYVDYNDVVKKGQRLAELDTSILRQEVLESESALKKAKADLDLSKLNYERTKELFKNNYIAKVELDQAETALKNSQEEYNIAKSKLDVAKINLNYAIITSPVSGVIISREVDVGQTVASSFSAPTLFEIAEDLTKMQIETSITEGDIGSMKNGQQINFTVDSFPNRMFAGKIRQIRLKPSTESNVVVYNVIIDINNKDKILMPGMTAYVSIPIGGVKNVKKISAVALKFNPTPSILKAMGIESKPEKKDGKVILYKLVGDKAIPIYVGVGLVNLSQAEIESDSLEKGDVIISNSTMLNKQKK